MKLKLDIYQMECPVEIPRYCIEDLTFKRVFGMDRIWFIPAGIPNPGDYIHVEINENHEGYGGRMIKFKDIDGHTWEVWGPWASNTDSLYLDTGIDLRDAHLTYGIITDGDSEILYQDDAPVVGKFNRIEFLAEEIATRIGKQVMFKFWSTGGSAAGPAYPLKEEQ